MKTFTLVLSSLFLFITINNNTATAQVKTFKKSFGGTNADYGHSLAATNDGGFIITGLTLSYGDTLGDIDLIKTDGNGNQLWSHIISGPKLEGGNSIVQTNDGGFFLICHTESYGNGDCDSWAIKMDDQGTIQWSNLYGGIADDVGEDGIETSTGNFLVTGIVRTWDYTGNVYLIKYNATGDTLWTNVYNEHSGEIGMKIVEAKDGGYIVSCLITTNSASAPDIWVFKTDIDGNVVWSNTYGGSGIDEAYGLVATADGGCIVAGSSTGFGSGDQDAYMFKLNSNGIQQWSRNYGGEKDDAFVSIAKTSDGGFILAGYTKSYADSMDILLIKTDDLGNLLWMKTPEESNYSTSAKWVVTCSDGGFAMTGLKQQYGSLYPDLYVVKTNQDGNFSTGIPEQQVVNSSFTIFPNPASTSIFLNYPNLNNTQIKIYDHLGKCILETQEQKSINVEQFLPGIYYIIVHNENQFFSQRFVRE